MPASPSSNKAAMQSMTLCPLPLPCCGLSRGWQHRRRRLMLIRKKNGETHFLDYTVMRQPLPAATCTSMPKAM